MLQQFEFHNDEKLMAILPKSYPFYYHEQLEDQQLHSLATESQGKKHPDGAMSVFDIPLDNHTVLDGCVIISNSTVYECKPRVSPERLFLGLCISQSDSFLIEQLGISLGLDLNFLFEKAADYLLQHGNNKAATRIFQMSKCSLVTRVSSFARHGYVQDVLPYIDQLLKKDNVDLEDEVKQTLIEMCINGLMYGLSRDPDNTQLQRSIRS